MTATTTTTRERKCFGCGNKAGVYLMSDKELTKGMMVNFCKACYWDQFGPVPVRKQK